MCGIAGAMSKPPNVRAGRAVSNSESMREMEQRIDRPRVTSADKARRHAAADVASGSVHGAGTSSAGGVQMSAQAENGDGSSLADMSQRDEIASLRDTGGHSAAMGARGLSALSEGPIAGCRVSKRVSKHRVSKYLFGCCYASPHDKACRLSCGRSLHEYMKACEGKCESPCLQSFASGAQESRTAWAPWAPPGQSARFRIRRS